MTDERERLEDLNIEEAVGRTTPPDLTARILHAAKHGKLEDAPTPISGAHAVPRSARPQGRRHTAAIPRRNWQGAGIVAAFTLLFAAGLVGFLMWKEPNPPTQQDTAEQPANQSPLRQRRDPEPNDSPTPKPQPKPEQPAQQPEPKPDDPVEQPKPDPKPDDPIEQPKPEPKPDDTVEQPKPEPKPDDTVEQPKPEPKPDDTVEQPKPDDKTEVKPEQPAAVVATIPATGWDSDRQYQLRRGDGWETAQAEPGADAIKLVDGARIKAGKGDILLNSGGLLNLDGEVSIHAEAEGLNVELIDDDLYVDNMAAASRVRITHAGLEILLAAGTALIEASSSRLGIYCIDGRLTAGGTEMTAGQVATLSKRGLSAIKQAGSRDWQHPLIKGAPPRRLLIEQFETAPTGRMISGVLETRTAKQLGTEKDGHVAVDTGRNAAVGFGLDGGHETLRGEMVRVRYRATGAEKMVLQLFCPARNDNFGIDLTPGNAGEWHVLEVRLDDLRNRETHKDAPAPGTSLSSFTLVIEGSSNAQLEIDWVEFVREARFGE